MAKNQLKLDLSDGRGKCQIPNCGNLVEERRLCIGHLALWNRDGRPDVDAFIAKPRDHRTAKVKLKKRKDGDE